MTVYNINVASEINATFVTHCGGFNCNIYNATARDFIYTQNILFTGMKGREEFFHIFCSTLSFSNYNIFNNVIMSPPFLKPKQLQFFENLFIIKICFKTVQFSYFEDINLFSAYIKIHSCSPSIQIYNSKPPFQEMTIQYLHFFVVCNLDLDILS